MTTIERTRRTETIKTLKCAAFCVALILFAFVGAYVLSSCGRYQPPGQDLWQAL